MRPPLEAGTVDDLVDDPPDLLLTVVREGAATRLAAATKVPTGSAIADALTLEAIHLIDLATDLANRRLELREVTPA